MNFSSIKHNLIKSSCILFLIIGCTKENTKLIVQNTQIIQKSNEKKITISEEKILNNKVIKNKITLKNDDIDQNSNNKIDQNFDKESVIFEFRNERLLQGRDVKGNSDSKKTNKALSAVLKMFEKNLSSNNVKLNLENKKNKTVLYKYFNETNKSINYKNILIFLPLTGKYSSFGNKIRKAIDLSILSFAEDEIKVIYFDTGRAINKEIITNLFERLKPRFVIGPFTREVLLEIKPLAKLKSIPIVTFSNDIAMIENNVWSLGFSPEEQIESVISCALMYGYKNFGIIAPDNLYGKIIAKHSKELISDNKLNSYENLFLSNKKLNNKLDLYSSLRVFLQYSENQTLHSKFDSVILAGGKEFILEIAPLLAFFNVDSTNVKILGTEIFDNKEIKNEPSLEKSWFPIISSKNDDQFKFLLKSVWGVNNNYFSNAGFDSGMIGIDFIKNKNHALKFLKKVEGPVTGLIFDTNGYVKKPIQVMQIEDLGKMTNIEKCRKFKD